MLLPCTAHTSLYTVYSTPDTQYYTSVTMCCIPLLCATNLGIHGIYYMDIPQVTVLGMSQDDHIF